MKHDHRTTNLSIFLLDNHICLQFCMLTMNYSYFSSISVYNHLGYKEKFLVDYNPSFHFYVFVW